MKSKATTVAAYLDSLSAERREAVEAVRRVILGSIDSRLRECMQYGVIGYCVPLEGEGGWPRGHHTNPKLPLMYMGVSSQKNDMVVYMLFLLHNKPERAWFEKAWKATGRKSRLEVGGMGCCLRFRKVEDLSLDVVAEAIRRVPVKAYLANHVAMLERIGKSGNAKGGKTPRAAAKGNANPKRKSARAAAKKKAVRKKAAAKRGE